MGLSISSGDGGQTSTQSPQGLVGSGSTTAAASNVQPGTATTLLTTGSGIALYPTQLPTVSVNTAPQTTTTSTPVVATTIQTKHHISGGLLGISAGLFIVALVVFWIITRSAKNTTNYK
ncbi:MAG TPA: hypothetical protein VNG32_05035 [Candidatus Dormibacteraeota bacterium]|nr:hypothetical protein [Candidatus Dormibacteraeota bacterium]